MLTKAAAGWISWGVVSFTALSLASVSVGQKIEYGSRMQKYDKWRWEFYSKKLYDTTYMCSSSNIKECSSVKNENKAYLPSPYEEKLWDLLLESLNTNNKDIREKHMQNQEQGIQEQLVEIKSSYQLKDYCYGEVKKAIEEANKEGSEKNNSYFNAGGNTHSDKKNHERCTLSAGELKIHIKK